MLKRRQNHLCFLAWALLPLLLDGSRIWTFSPKAQAADVASLLSEEKDVELLQQPKTRDGLRQVSKEEIHDRGAGPISTVDAGPSSYLEQHDDHHHNHGGDDDDNKSNEEKFCRGMFMTMMMDGFRWSLKGLMAYSSAEHHHHHHHTSSNSTDDNSEALPPCLSYYVSSWKLNMSGKFRGAMVFSFLMALLTEGLSATRFKLIDYVHVPPPRRGVGVGGGPSSLMTTRIQTKNRKLLLTAVYALQQWMGTMIMLVSMMYSVELLLSVIAGLIVGNFLFMRENTQNKPGLNFGMMNPAVATAPTTDTAAAGVAQRVADEERQSLLHVTSPASAPISDSFNCCGDSTSSRGLQMQATRKDD
jgi:hypothetical protein